MEKNNTEILKKVKNLVLEPKTEDQKIVDESKSSNRNNSDELIKKEVRQWVYSNAEKIAKEIIEEEVKKIFK